MSLRAREAGVAIQLEFQMDCFVAALLAMTTKGRVADPPTLKHRQCLRAFEHDPRTTADQRKLEDVADEFAPAQHRVLQVGVEFRAVVLRHEAHEPRLPKPSAGVAPQSETDDRAMAEVAHKHQGRVEVRE